MKIYIKILVTLFKYQKLLFKTPYQTALIVFDNLCAISLCLSFFIQKIDMII